MLRLPMLLVLGIPICLMSMASSYDDEHPFGTYPEVRAFVREIAILSLFLCSIAAERARDIGWRS